LAARRLIAILLVLLFLSSLAAALAPVGRDRAPIGPVTSTGTTTTSTGPGVVPVEPVAEGGSLVRERVAASAAKPQKVKAAAGDQLQLRVTSRTPGTLSIPVLGVSEDVDPEAPADFDVLLTDPGTFHVVFLGSDKAVASIEVSPRSAPLR
jgi:hypothetical protein